MKNTIFKICLLILSSSYCFSLLAQDCSHCEQLALKLEKAWNEKDEALKESLLHPDYSGFLDGKKMNSPEETMAGYNTILTENDNLKIDFKVEVCDENACVFSYQCSGYSKAYKMNWELSGLNIYRLENGLIKEEIENRDMLGAFLRAGFTLQPPGDGGKKE